jgi:hypothetical protein
LGKRHHRAQPLPVELIQAPGRIKGNRACQANPVRIGAMVADQVNEGFNELPEARIRDPTFDEYR